MIKVRNLREQFVWADETKLITRPSAYGFIMNEGRLLVVDTRAVNGKYWLVGGNIDPGEQAESTIIREALEETGHEVQVRNLIYEHAYNFAHPDKHFYHCTAKYFTATSEDMTMLPHEKTPIAWIPLIEVSPLGFHVLIQDAVREFLKFVTV